MSNQRSFRRRGDRNKGILPVAATAFGLPVLLFTPGPGMDQESTFQRAMAPTHCEVAALHGGDSPGSADLDTGVLTLTDPTSVAVTGPGCAPSLRRVAVSVGKYATEVEVPPRGLGAGSSGLVPEGDDPAPELVAMTLDNGAIVAYSGHPEEDIDSHIAALYPDLGWERPAHLPEDTADAHEQAGPSWERPESRQDDTEVDPYSHSGHGDGAMAAQEGVACTRTDRNHEGRNESDDHTWRFRTASIPAYLNSAQTVLDARMGPDGWEQFPRTDCLTVPFNSIRHTYAGSTSQTPNVNASMQCGGGNGQNTWAFFDPTGTGGPVARACYWFIPLPFLDDEVTEADVVFNLHYTWGSTVDECTPGGVGKYMVSAVATHEAGHVFGFGHVDQASLQTMGPQSTTCSKNQASLGRGDMLVAHEEYAP